MFQEPVNQIPGLGKSRAPAPPTMADLNEKWDAPAEEARVINVTAGRQFVDMSASASGSIGIDIADERKSIPSTAAALPGGAPRNRP